MENPYAASSSEGYEPQGESYDPENLAVLQPGQSVTPIRLGRTGSTVPTTIQVTELPIPTIYTKTDTPAKREAFRKTEHARKHYPIMDDDMGDRMDRIARVLQPPSQPKPRQQPLDYIPQGSGFENDNSHFMLYLGLGLLVLAGGALVYKLFTDVPAPAAPVATPTPPSP